MNNSISLYLFGSAARGDRDNYSDLDILAIYDEQPDSVLRKKVLSLARTKFGDRVSLAEYSSQRLARMFEDGHLFAWHLYQEAKPLQLTGLLSQQSFVFGLPAPYVAGIEDAHRFAGLLSSVIAEVRNGSTSLVHEAGLSYLALRNIAMSLSTKLLRKADFTRYSPLNVSASLGIRPPCTSLEFDLLVAARHASQRGGPPPKIDEEAFRGLLDQSHDWVNAVLEKANE